ncbi:MAG: hypothetical protein KC422_18165 [Trueperaceae bacterium]|nr:hypothetical protein [Trueperaceae bacterium]
MTATLAQGKAPLYGFTAFPYDLTLEALENVNTLVIDNSSLYAVHNMGFGDCLPWQEALKGQAFPQWIQDDWADIKARIPAGVPLSVHITPTQSDRYTLAYQCGITADEAGQMPQELIDKPYNDPQIITAYSNFAKRVVDYFEPDFLIIGIEMSELSLSHPEEWEKFAELMTATLERLHASQPNLKLSVEFVLQSLLLPRVAEQVKPLVEQLDFLGISFYPYGSEFGEYFGAPALPAPPAQWLEPLEWLRSYTEKPIAIVETGYSSKHRKVNNVNFTGDEALQAAFLKDLIRFAKEDSYLYLIWFVPVDYEKLLAKLPQGDTATVAEIWVNTGLFDSDLKPKLAWRTWQTLKN